MSLQNVAEQYFGKLNSIAKRLTEDVNDTKAAYDSLWNRLPENEKEQIINESIIKPEVSLKYRSLKSNRQSAEKYALKTVVDDNCTYRDEHSAPFCFRTPSQRDLRIFGEIKEFTSTNEQALIKDTNFESCDIHQLSKHINNDEQSENDHIPCLPKTGLDLLDNW